MKFQSEVEKNKLIYLSYILNQSAPSYGQRNKFELVKKSSISNGDIANDSFISTTVHMGTHIDMPYHFFENGQTIENFSADFFDFKCVLFLSLTPNGIILKDELLKLLEQVAEKEQYEIIIVKTGICHKRNMPEFSLGNYGFDPIIAEYIRNKFPNVRVFGFDSISVSSFLNRELGREAHKAFLQPSSPIILLEDMDLTMCSIETKIKHLTIAPLRISGSDGLPCTVIVEVE